jgi:hypothetical protein
MLRELRFSQHCWWGFETSEICHHVTDPVVHNISKDYVPFIFNHTQYTSPISSSWTGYSWKWMWQHPLEHTNHSPCDTASHTRTPESLRNHMFEQGQNTVWEFTYYCFKPHVFFSWHTSRFTPLCCHLLLQTTRFTFCIYSSQNFIFISKVTELLIWNATTSLNKGHRQGQQQEESSFLRSALFWGITQHRVVILYRRFGTTYWSHLQGSRSPRRVYSLLFCDFLTLEDGTNTSSRNVSKGLPLDAALHPRRTQSSSASPQKPEIQVLSSLLPLRRLKEMNCHRLKEVELIKHVKY